MITALALPTQVHVLLTILGFGTLLFLALLIVIAWCAGPISTKRGLAICAICVAIWVLVAAIRAGGQVITALAVPTKAHVLLTILGEGTLLFVVCLISAVVPWIGKRISTKCYISICGVCTAIWVLVAAAFAIKG